eukprot:TRINITY_DN11513_c0_g1_i1.p1 TRINITY_DN11513_c0_g1~~TRINITY_DN11513_c0_g1_i1.p1  ORF type:complete len:363 (+),score=51.18 TRINITY_DN11513_c0_g1_i1:36-1091(+)
MAPRGEWRVDHRGRRHADQNVAPHRDPESAPHRRARKKRSNARLTARLADAIISLHTHHGSHLLHFVADAFQGPQTRPGRSRSASPRHTTFAAPVVTSAVVKQLRTEIVDLTNAFAVLQAQVTRVLRQLEEDRASAVGHAAALNSCFDNRAPVSSRCPAKLRMPPHIDATAVGSKEPMLGPASAVTKRGASAVTDSMARSETHAVSQSSSEQAQLDGSFLAVSPASHAYHMRIDDPAPNDKTADVDVLAFAGTCCELERFSQVCFRIPTASSLESSRMDMVTSDAISLLKQEDPSDRAVMDIAYNILAYYTASCDSDVRLFFAMLLKVLHPKFHAFTAFQDPDVTKIIRKH